MLSIIKSMALQGLDGYLIDVQVDISNGMPYWEVVGLPDACIKESKERVRIAIQNSGFSIFSKRIIVNLAPAMKRKEGSLLDLPIAIGILYSLGLIVNQNFDDTIFIGELSLNGTINKINGVLPICIEAAKLGIKRVIVPVQNYREASIVENLEIIAEDNLKNLVSYLNGQKPKNVIEINNSIEELDSILDFSEVKGQKNVKRAIEVAASGAHNILLTGIPGSGKTMMAQRIPTILPKLTVNEALEVTKIHSVAGLLSDNLHILTKRPFRSPHYSISTSSLIGGGKIPKPGEISLSHNGVLYLDELTEFKQSTLEALRSPIEDGKVTISRVNATLTYPSDFMLVASMNPCPCGYFGSSIKCTCTEKERNKYLSKISGPLLDRIDIKVEVNPVKFNSLRENSAQESSEKIRERVKIARQIQYERYKNLGINTNSQLKGKLVDEFCQIDTESEEILKKMFTKLNLSARGYTRILKVARTIADMDESKNIKSKHLLEAIQYRNLSIKK